MQLPFKSDKTKKRPQIKYCIVSFVFTGQLTLPVFFISLYGFKLLCSILSFQPKDPLQCFLKGKTVSDKFFQLLFIWKCLNFFFLFLYDSFAEYRILGWQYFWICYGPLGMLCQQLLAPWLVIKSQMFILLRFSCMLRHFALAAVNIFS